MVRPGEGARLLRRARTGRGRTGRRALRGRTCHVRGRSAGRRAPRRTCSDHDHGHEVARRRGRSPMSPWYWVLAGAGAALAVYVIFVITLVIAGRKDAARAAARFVPD